MAFFRLLSLHLNWNRFELGWECEREREREMFFYHDINMRFLLFNILLKSFIIDQFVYKDTEAKAEERERGSERTLERIVFSSH